MINIIVKVLGKDGNSSNTGRHEKQQRGSIMRKQKKFEEGKHLKHVNKDDMQLTIENIMLLSGIVANNVLLQTCRWTGVITT